MLKRAVPLRWFFRVPTTYVPTGWYIYIQIDHHDHGAVVEEAPASYHANEARPITTDTLDIVSTWTPEDVRTWMSKHKLTE